MNRFTKFLLTSGIATLVNIVSRAVLSFVMPYEVTIIIAHLIGMAVAYTLARLYVFDPSGGGIKQEMLGFAFVNLLSMAQVWLISVGLYRFVFPAMDWTFQPALCAHIVGVGSLVFTSYFGHKHISFRQKPEDR